MPRACVIVLDAGGAGALPDAADFGDEGSDTLGNVARAVGGLDLPSLEALGLGNVEPLEGCPPQPGRRRWPEGCSSGRKARTRQRATGSTWESSPRRRFPPTRMASRT